MKIKLLLFLLFFINSTYNCKIFSLRSTPIIITPNININSNLNDNDYIDKKYNNILIEDKELDKYLETNLTIIDDNIYNNEFTLSNKCDIFFTKGKIKIQRVLSDVDINQKNVMIISRHNIIDIMNKWNYSNKSASEIDNLFKFLFMFFYVNRNVKKNIGVFNFNNICECLLFYEYRLINNTYILSLKKRILNPFIENITLLNKNETKIYNNINKKILSYKGDIYNSNINKIVNDNKDNTYYE